MAPKEVNSSSIPIVESPVIQIDNFINNEFVAPSTNEYLPVHDPSTQSLVGRVALSNDTDVNHAVASARSALTEWSTRWTIRARAALMLRFHALVREHTEELARLIVRENGKNLTEARADVAKGLETVEYAGSLASHTVVGRTMMRVSSRVSCAERRDPVGVVACVVPFNFPFMVPMWTVPLALVTGNCVVLKPSEKVPLTMHRTAELLRRCGLPRGVFAMVQGRGVPVVNALVDHPDVHAVTFVGSSPVASVVASRCRALHKRCTALGGAKNHLVALKDCDVEETARDIVVSFAGCAGQRCMAASVLLLVGEQDELLHKIVQLAREIQPGTGPGQMGPVIDDQARTRILGMVQHAVEHDQAELLLDGRCPDHTAYTNINNNYVGPTILRHRSPDDEAMTKEIFGPVLSVYVVSSYDEAVRIENDNPYGNAAAVYTSRGNHAEWFCARFRAAMLGVNVGIPVPREPFSFGGLSGTRSKYGDMDITGDGAVEFFTNRIKITTKWPELKVDTVGQIRENGTTATTNTDHANFAGNM